MYAGINCLVYQTGSFVFKITPYVNQVQLIEV
jgi:hypothetical protein